MLPEAVSAWHDAVNRRDLAAARRTVTDPVDVSGPRGTQAISAAAFADWILTSGITLKVRSVHPIDAATVVVEQEATWPGAATLVATVFQVRDGAVSLVHRFDSLPAALDAARALAHKDSLDP